MLVRLARMAVEVTPSSAQHTKTEVRVDQPGLDLKSSDQVDAGEFLGDRRINLTCDLELVD
jgi:hypothetical protein